MPEIILGVVVLALLLWLSNAFAAVDPRRLAPALRLAGGLGALGGALFLASRGVFVIALPLGVAGFGVLGWLGNWFRPQDRAASRVRSAFVEMELDHRTGAMRGRVLAGPHEGKSLDLIAVSTIVSFLPQIDEESRALLMAYLDRRQPRWREHAERDAAAGEGAGRRAKMTEEEAYQILGLQPGASAADVARAHRALMKKLHPDQGGSTYLAARVNEAKDILQRRHR
jgi:hypothetical protein